MRDSFFVIFNEKKITRFARGPRGEKGKPPRLNAGEFAALVTVDADIESFKLKHQEITLHPATPQISIAQGAS